MNYRIEIKCESDLNIKLKIFKKIYKMLNKKEFVKSISIIEYPSNELIKMDISDISLI